MKQRVAYLEIDGKTFGDTNGGGLNMSFDVPYTGTGFVPNNSSFTLTNLNSEDLKYIVTNTARFTERRRKIKCFAGYADNIKQIFGGEIFQASPASLPDTTVNITAISNIADMGELINVKLENPTFIELIEDARKRCGYGIFITDSVKNSNILQRSVGQNYSFTGSPVEYLSDIETMLGVHTKQSADAMAFVVASNILHIGWQNDRFPAPAPIINAENGMIGIPTPTEVGVNIRVLLDVSLQPLQTIELKSKTLSLYNGLYNIINIRHTGSLRGRDWYSELECVKVA